MIKLIGLILMLLSSQALAQGTQQSLQTGGRPSSSARIGGYAVPTQPSSDPFRDPLGQGVPPAASSVPRFNNNRTQVPLGTH
jgi:hypothetical protein